MQAWKARTAKNTRLGGSSHRRIVTEAAIQHLANAKESDSSDVGPLYEDIIHHYTQRLDSLDQEEEEGGDHHRHQALALEALRVERRTAIRLRDEGRIHDEILRRIERELDLNESRMNTL